MAWAKEVEAKGDDISKRSFSPAVCCASSQDLSKVVVQAQCKMHVCHIRTLQMAWGGVLGWICNQGLLLELSAVFRHLWEAPA